MHQHLDGSAAQRRGHFPAQQPRRGARDEDVDVALVDEPTDERFPPRDHLNLVQIEGQLAGDSAELGDDHPILPLTGHRGGLGGRRLLGDPLRRARRPGRRLAPMRFPVLTGVNLYGALCPTTLGGDSPSSGKSIATGARAPPAPSRFPQRSHGHAGGSRLLDVGRDPDPHGHIRVGAAHPHPIPRGLEEDVRSDHYVVGELVLRHPAYPARTGSETT